MGMGRYTRIDRKKSSVYCSTGTIVVIVSACLIGAWIMIPSSTEAERDTEQTVKLTKGGKQQGVSENYTKEFEDNSGDLVKNVVNENDDQENVKDVSDSDTHTNKNALRESENSGEMSQVEEFEKTNSNDNETVESNERKAEVENDQENVKDVSDSDTHTSKNVLQESENPREMGQVEEFEKTNSNDNETVESNDEKAEVKKYDESLSGDKRSTVEDADEINQGEAETKTEEVAVHDSDEKAEDKTETDEQKLRDQSQEDSNNGSNKKTSVSEWEDQADAMNETSSRSEESVNNKNFSSSSDQSSYKWKLCKVTAGPDYIPCLDNIKAIRKLRSITHYEHQERHCPDEAPTCLVPLPEGYKIPVKWPKSREKVWFANVPHTKLAEVKGHQNWVRVSGEYLTFPGGGTQFTHGAMRYIDFIEKTVADISWGKRTRVVLDIGCGVASFGGFLLDKNVITMSLAPKDVHEAQVQFALERGIPAISAVIGSKRLPFPSMAFDAVHCARCRISWHMEGGKLLLELDRVLRPGGYFVWSATPIYRKDPENVGIWKAMSRLTKSICWDLVKIGKDKVNGVGVAIYRKPSSNECYENRRQNDPPLCQESDDPNSAWYEPLEACIYKVPTDESKRGSLWPTKWPSRLERPPYWLEDSKRGVYGTAAPKDFNDDYKRWKLIVTNSYLNGIGIDWSSVRNVMDMRAVYGGFAAALKDMQLWVMNVVPINSTDTLPIIYERGLLGIYHDWCESFSTYPRSYDLLHAVHLFSDVKKRCNFVAVMAEVDRVLRPEGFLVVRDDSETLNEVEELARSLKWEIRFSYSMDNEGMVCIQKTRWRPSEEETILSAIV